MFPLLCQSCTDIYSSSGSNILPFYCKGFIANLTIQRQFFPTEEDETGAAKALMRLQDTYKLDPETLSRGNLPGQCTKDSLALTERSGNILKLSLKVLYKMRITCFCNRCF